MGEANGVQGTFVVKHLVTRGARVAGKEEVDPSATSLGNAASPQTATSGKPESLPTLGTNDLLWNKGRLCRAPSTSCLHLATCLHATTPTTKERRCVSMR